jgi:hypothetical protein
MSAPPLKSLLPGAGAGAEEGAIGSITSSPACFAVKVASVDKV